MQRIKLITKICCEVLLRLGGNGKIPGGIPQLKDHRDDGLNTDAAGNLRKQSMDFIRGMILRTNLVQKLQ